MRLTIYNFIMSFLWCNICIILFVALRRRHRFISRHGLAPLFALLLFGLVRFFVTIEFPFTLVIESDSILADIQRAVRQPSHVFGLTYIQLFIWAWLFVSAALILKMITGIVRQNLAIAKMERGDSSGAERILDELLEELGRRNKYRLIVSPDIALPAVTGFFTPTILLPEMEISESDLRYILLHEWSHFANRDMWVKLFLNIFRAAFWWNPLVHILEKDLGFILEIQSDSTATKRLNSHEKIGYVQAIVNVLRKARPARIAAPLLSSGIAGGPGGASKIQERLTLLLFENRRSVKTAVLTAATLMLLCVLSYMVVFQPAGFPPDMNEFIQVNSENAYIEITDDGQYALYIEDRFWRYILVEELQLAPHDTLEIRK